MAHSAAVVLKLVGSGSFQKHELEDFPEDMDELDDVVLTSIVTDGESYEMKVNGQLLTPEKYVECKRAGHKLVIQVRKQAAELPAPSAPAPSAPTWETLPGLPPSRASSYAGSNPPSSGESPDVQKSMQALHEVRKQLSSVATGGVYDRGHNVLCLTMQAEADMFKKIKQDTVAIETRDIQLGLEAAQLVDEMISVFDCGLTHTLNTRDGIYNLQLTFKGLADAFVKGDVAGVQLHLFQCRTFAEKLKSESETVTKDLAALQKKLKDKFNDYAAAEKKYRNRQIGTGVATGVSGAGAIGAGAGGYMVGVTTTTSYYFAASTVAWNPVGLALVGATVVGGVAVGALGYFAASYGAAKENSGNMKDTTQKAQTVSNVNANLWKGVSMHLGTACNKVDALNTFSPAQLELFANATRAAAESMFTIQQAVDEYLVYIDRLQVYPVNFNIESVMGSQRYKHIKDSLSIKIVS